MFFAQVEFELPLPQLGWKGIIIPSNSVTNFQPPPPQFAVLMYIVQNEIN